MTGASMKTQAFQASAAIVFLFATPSAEAALCAHRPVDPACAYFSCARWGQCQSGGRATQGCLRYSCRIENRNFGQGTTPGNRRTWQAPRFKLPPPPKLTLPKRPPPISKPLPNPLLKHR
jgi:hypothetical protein